MGGARTDRSRTRLRALGAAVAALVAAAALAACGSSSSDSSEPEGTYEVKVTKAEFPTEQDLGQTSLMKIGVENTGDKTMPVTAVTISIAGEEGETSSLPFGVHDPQPGLAQPDRPVWVLAEGFPKTPDTKTKRGGVTTLARKTFNFGPLDPGKSVEGIWNLSAVRAGHYTVLYRVGPGLSGTAKAKTAGGVAPGGSFKVDVTTKTPQTEVTDSGEVVEIGHGREEAAKRSGQGKKSSNG